jgi:hypothetical protein
MDDLGIDSAGNIIRVSFIMFCVFAEEARHQLSLIIGSGNHFSGLETIHGKFHGINAVSPLWKTGYICTRCFQCSASQGMEGLVLEGVGELGVEYLCNRRPPSVILMTH